MGWSGALDRMRLYRHVSGVASDFIETPYRFRALTAFDMMSIGGQKCEHGIM